MLCYYLIQLYEQLLKNQQSAQSQVDLNNPCQLLLCQNDSKVGARVQEVFCTNCGRVGPMGTFCPADGTKLTVTDVQRGNLIYLCFGKVPAEPPLHKPGRRWSDEASPVPKRLKEAYRHQRYVAKSENIRAHLASQELELLRRQLHDRQITQAETTALLALRAPYPDESS